VLLKPNNLVSASQMDNTVLSTECDILPVFPLHCAADVLKTETAQLPECTMQKNEATPRASDQKCRNSAPGVGLIDKRYP